MGESIKSFDLKTICEEMGHKENLLVEAKNSNQIDCMGRVVEIADFCEKKYPLEKDGQKLFLTKASIGMATKRGYCERGEAVLLRLNCESDHKSFCTSAKSGCEKLGKVFARQLPAIESTKVGQILRCFYSAPEESEISFKEDF